MKKGKQWALSCVAVSTVVLVGASATNVCADTTATTTQSTATSTQKPVTEAENSEVQDGGHVSDDLKDNTATNDLGYAAYFHIFANEATLNAHTNGNVAVGHLTGKVNFGTNTHEKLLNKDISYIQNFDQLASSLFVSSGDTRENKVIFGSESTIDVSDANRPLVNGTYIDHLVASEVYEDKGSNKYIDFASEFAKLESKSTELANKDPQVSAKNSDFPDRNQRVINLDNYQPNDKNQIVINLDSDVLAADTPLTIYGLSKDAGGTNVIINVDTNGQDQYTINSQIKLIYNDGSSKVPEERPNQETEYFDDNHLLWNFYNDESGDKLYDGMINIDRPFQGSILAPNATVNANQNVDGNIVADKVNVNAETHRWDLQDNSETETEYQDFIKLPGELPELPDEENNNGGNVEKPDEIEDKEIDPDTGNIVDPDEGSGTTDPETPSTVTPDPKDPDKDKKPSTETPSTTDPDTDKKPDTDKGTDTDDDDDPIIHGGSEGSAEDNNSTSSKDKDDNDLEEGLLSGVVGNDKDESQTPSNSSDTTNGNETGTLPQTGATSGVLATIAGLLLIVIGFLSSGIRSKKH